TQRYHDFIFSIRGRNTYWPRDWTSDVCSSDLHPAFADRGHNVARLHAHLRRRPHRAHVHDHWRLPRLPKRARDGEARIRDDSRVDWKSVAYGKIIAVVCL